MKRPTSLESLKPESRPTLQDITVLIPTVGRQLLQESLYWLAVGSHWPERLCVVAQGLHSNVELWMRILQHKGIDAQCIRMSTRGRSSALNQGLSAVTTSFVAITDDDCFADAMWLKTIWEALRHERSAVVTGRVETLGGDDTGYSSPGLQPTPFSRLRPRHEVLSGGNMGASLSIFNSIGYFDEDPRLSTAEDCDWAYRAVCSGFRIQYLPDAVVHHLTWRDASERTRQYCSYARSHGGFYGKHLRKGDLSIGVRAVVHHLRALRRWVYGTLKGNREQAAIGRAYFTGLLPGMVKGSRHLKT